MEYIAILLILLAGIGNPVQTAVNSRLRFALGTPLISSTVSFTVGLLVLALLTLLTCGTLFVPASVASQVPWWAWGGGVIGAVMLTALIVVFPKLGGVLTVLLPMIGQIFLSILIDTFGWFGTEPIPLSVPRVAGLLLVTAGLVCYVVGKGRQEDSGSGAKGVGIVWLVAGVLIGFCFAIQPVMNGVLATVLSSSVHASFISFAISTVILYILLLAMPGERSHMARMFRPQSPWWMWTGGLLGAYFVTMFAWFTPLLGIGVCSVVSIFGQLVSGAAIEGRGLFGNPARRINALQYIGIGLVLPGVVLVNL